MPLPKTTLDRINEDSRAYAKRYGRKEIGYYALNYEAGATAEAERAKTGIDLLKSMVLEFEGAAEMSDKDYDKNLIKKCKIFLQQWNERKDVQNPAITHEQAIDLLNPPEDKEPQGMPLPPKELFD